MKFYFITNRGFFEAEASLPQPAIQGIIIEVHGRSTHLNHIQKALEAAIKNLAQLQFRDTCCVISATRKPTEEYTHIFTVEGSEVNLISVLRILGIDDKMIQEAQAEREFTDLH